MVELGDGRGQLSWWAQSPKSMGAVKLGTMRGFIDFLNIHKIWTDDRNLICKGCFEKEKKNSDSMSYVSKLYL